MVINPRLSKVGFKNLLEFSRVQSRPPLTDVRARNRYPSRLKGTRDGESQGRCCRDLSPFARRRVGKERGASIAYRNCLYIRDVARYPPRDVHTYNQYGFIGTPFLSRFRRFISFGVVDTGGERLIFATRRLSTRAMFVVEKRMTPAGDGSGERQDRTGARARHAGEGKENCICGRRERQGGRGR